jgi:hypothetical protein
MPRELVELKSWVPYVKFDESEADVLLVCKNCKLDAKRHIEMTGKLFHPVSKQHEKDHCATLLMLWLRR